MNELNGSTRTGSMPISYKDMPSDENHGLPKNIRGGFCWHDWGFRWLKEEQAFECRACGMKVTPETWRKWNPNIEFEEQTT